MDSFDHFEQGREVIKFASYAKTYNCDTQNVLAEYILAGVMKINRRLH
jgi:hypothetical protein